MIAPVLVGVFGWSASCYPDRYGRGSTGAIPNQAISAGRCGKMVGIVRLDRFQTRSQRERSG